ncbi:unnamed protein product [Allacma fusca]|uniref:Uncharacterized protein n=1 Tax=Allacma fusca TaxID=39272 RepID=A0A8J2P4V5_9HEXA|nr:unnamed protein product [Allacma fusca]
MPALTLPLRPLRPAREFSTRSVSYPALQPIILSRALYLGFLLKARYVIEGPIFIKILVRCRSPCRLNQILYIGSSLDLDRRLNLDHPLKNT